MLLTTKYDRLTGLPSVFSDYTHIEVNIDLGVVSNFTTTATGTIFGTSNTIPRIPARLNQGRFWLAEEGVDDSLRGGTRLDAGKRFAEEGVEIPKFGGFVGQFATQITVNVSNFDAGTILRFEFDDTIRIDGVIQNSRIIYMLAKSSFVFSTLDGQGHLRIISIDNYRLILSKKNASEVYWTDTIGNRDGRIEFGIYQDTFTISFDEDWNILKLINMNNLRNVTRTIRVKDKDGKDVDTSDFVITNLKAKNNSLTRYEMEFTNRIGLDKERDFIGASHRKEGLQSVDISWYCNRVFGSGNWTTHNLPMNEVTRIVIHNGFIKAQKRWDAILLLCEAIGCNVSYRNGRYELWRIII